MLLGVSNGDLFEHLEKASQRVAVGDPDQEAFFQREGPKGIAAADLDRDGDMDLAVSNLDGTVTLLYGNDAGEFPDVRHVQTGARSLRGIAAAEFVIDEAPRVATVDPFRGELYVLAPVGDRDFAVGQTWPLWEGARDLVADDFDGDHLPDLVVAGPNKGMMFLRGTGSTIITEPWFSDFRAFEELNVDNDVGTDRWIRNRRPVYALAPFRKLGESAAGLLVSHADAAQVFLYEPDAESVFRLTKSLDAGAGVHRLETGRLFSTEDKEFPDLAVAMHDEHRIQLYRELDTPGPSIPTNGRPRDVKIVDVDNDGWNDLVVVLRDANRLATYRNVAGEFQLVSENMLGVSPREAVLTDLNEDDRPDVAVINRVSQDVSVLMFDPHRAGWQSPDIYIATAGEVNDLQLTDLNGDGADDAILLHRLTGEVAVHLSSGLGTTPDLWQPPQLYAMGRRGIHVEIADINGDSFRDLVVANETDFGIRYGDASGRFGDLQTMIPEKPRPWQTVSVLEATGDGRPDLAAVSQDGYLVFFEQRAWGTFAARGSTFISEGPRDAVSVDLDEDGDRDLVVLGVLGVVSVVENHQHLGETMTLEVARYETGQVGSSSIQVFYRKDDVRLLVGSEDWVELQPTGEGARLFESRRDRKDGRSAINAFAVLDFGSSGLDFVSVSPSSTLEVDRFRSVFGGGPDNISIPPTKHIASGDIDGDGDPDLVGASSELWAIRSSLPPESTIPGPFSNVRPKLSSIVINEIMAWNKIHPVAESGGRFSDWIELYNGSDVTVDLDGWTVRLIKFWPDGEVKAVLDYQYLNEALIDPGDHQLLIFSEGGETDLHTGFKLPKEGGALILIDSEGMERHRVEYPFQLLDHSYARFGDADEQFVFNRLPSPGRSNTAFGDREDDPVISPLSVDANALAANEPIRFSIYAWGDSPASFIRVHFRRLDLADSLPEQLILFDDGRHDDGESRDGLFAGTLTNGLPPGGQLELYAEIVRLNDSSIIVPNAPLFANVAEGEAITNHTFAFPDTDPGLRISEVVARNESGLVDEEGNRSDWLEIHNTSSEALSLSGYGLKQGFFDEPQNVFHFPQETIIEAGGFLVVFLDGDTGIGSLHAPFRVRSFGDSLYLFRRTDSGLDEVIDSVATPGLETDQSYARVGETFEIHDHPTPYQSNRQPFVPDLRIRLWPDRDHVRIQALPRPGRILDLEISTSMEPGSWEAVFEPTGEGDPLDFTLPRTAKQRYYRVIERSP